MLINILHMQRMSWSEHRACMCMSNPRYIMLFPLLKCQRCGMPHFFGEKKWVPNSAGCARNCARPWVWSASLRELWVPLRPPGAPCPVLGPLASSRIGSIHLGGRLVSGNGCGSKLATKKWRRGMTNKTQIAIALSVES